MKVEQELPKVGVATLPRLDSVDLSRGIFFQLLPPRLDRMDTLPPRMERLDSTSSRDIDLKCHKFKFSLYQS